MTSGRDRSGRSAERGAAAVTLLLVLVFGGAAVHSVDGLNARALEVTAITEIGSESAPRPAADVPVVPGRGIGRPHGAVRAAPRFMRPGDHAWPPPRAPGRAAR